jgi:hypothetical protein
MRQVAKGVQLPPDSTGRITGGFVTEEFDDTTGTTNDVVLPATVLVDAEGGELGRALLNELETLNHTLGEIQKQNQLILQALTR